MNKNEYELQLQKIEEEHRFALSRISHEIRNPVTLISSSLQVIEQEHPEVREFAFWNEAKEDLAYLRSLLEELSGYNNGDALTLTRLSATEWLESLVPGLTLLAASKQSDLHCAITRDLPVIQADPVKLRQVFTNLVRNSLEAGCTLVEFSAFTEESCLMVTVSDNGCGIPTEDVSTIFQPFVTHKSGGTGLGLALSKRIVEAHGGQLRLSSSNSSGTSFTVLLPIRSAASPKPRTNPAT